MLEDGQGKSASSSTGATPPAALLPAVRLALRALRWATIAGIAALLLASATLLLYGVVETLVQIAQMVWPGTQVTNRDVFLSSIKLIDLVLLATIMQMVGIGLYSLFVDDRLPFPKWLVSTDVDALKNKLAGVVAVMLGVSFLEQVFYWGSERDLLRLGLATAAVIVALSLFIHTHSER